MGKFLLVVDVGSQRPPPFNFPPLPCMTAVSGLSPHGVSVISGKRDKELLYLLCVPVLTHSIWAMTNSTYPEGLLPTTDFWNQFLYQLRFCCNNRSHFRLPLSRERNTKSPRRGSLYLINQRLPRELTELRPERLVLELFGMRLLDSRQLCRLLR